jgi:hypothetical protein
MKKKYLIKAFDGKKEFFVKDFEDPKAKKALTKSTKDAYLADSEANAINVIDGLVMADEIAEILGKDLVPDEAMYTALPVYVKS